MGDRNGGCILTSAVRPGVAHDARDRNAHDRDVREIERHHPDRDDDRGHDEMSVTDSLDPIVRNTLLTYTTTVVNNGPAMATNAVVMLMPPSAVESNSPSPSQAAVRASATIGHPQLHRIGIGQ
jgi:uncharacterized repeat protein (TIGR01451 family)